VGLVAELGGGPVGLDTAVFIYFIEEHPRFLPRNEALTPVSGGSQLHRVNFRAPSDPKEPM